MEFIDDPSGYVAEVILFYYETLNNPCGGYLHVVLDEENTEDCSVQFCMGEAEKNNDHVGVAIGKLLLQLTEEQRIEAINQARSMNPNWHGGLIGDPEDDQPQSCFTATGMLIVGDVKYESGRG